jgi:hypothetical protein
MVPHLYGQDTKSNCVRSLVGSRANSAPFPSTSRQLNSCLTHNNGTDVRIAVLAQLGHHGTYLWERATHHLEQLGCRGRRGRLVGLLHTLGRAARASLAKRRPTGQPSAVAQPYVLPPPRVVASQPSDGGHGFIEENSLLGGSTSPCPHQPSPGPLPSSGRRQHRQGAFDQCCIRSIRHRLGDEQLGLELRPRRIALQYDQGELTRWG